MWRVVERDGPVFGREEVDKGPIQFQSPPLDKAKRGGGGDHLGD